MLMDDAVVKYEFHEESPIVEQKRRGLYRKKQVRRVKRRLSTRSVHQLAHNAHHVRGFAGWAYVRTIAFTGMRSPGEMFALQRGYASPYWPASEPDDELREEALQRYESLHALRVQYQTYRADGQAVLAAPKYDSARTFVLPPFLHETHQVLLASHDQPWAFLSLQGSRCSPPTSTAPTGFRPGRCRGADTPAAVRAVGAACAAGGRGDGRRGNLPAAALAQGEAGRARRHPASGSRGADGP